MIAGGRELGRDAGGGARSVTDDQQESSNDNNRLHKVMLSSDRKAHRVRVFESSQSHFGEDIGDHGGRSKTRGGRENARNVVQAAVSAETIALRPGAYFATAPAET